MNGGVAYFVFMDISSHIIVLYVAYFLFLDMDYTGREKSVF